MHIHVRIHHWVLVWFYVGVVCGAVAVVNILFRNPDPAQVKWILVIGALHWLIGGTLCYAWDAVRIEKRGREPQKPRPARPRVASLPEWHYASEFVLPGNRKSLLPPKY